MAVGIQAINARSACDELRDKVQADHVSVHPDQLEIPEHRLREIKPATVRELAESIKEVGLLQPIGVKYAGACTNRFIVIYGAHRALACQLLRREALEKATDPNTDQEVFRYSQVHALRYRKEIDDDVCEELEIRENLNRKELTFNQRKAQMLLLAAIVQKRMKKRDKTHNVKLISQENLDKSKNKRGVMVGKPVHNAIAETLGVHPQTLKDRVGSASLDIGKKLDLDQTPPEELKAAARIISEKKPVKHQNQTSHPSVLSRGTLNKNGIQLKIDIYPTQSHRFAEWIRKRHPASFSLDDIRAYRDALADLVKELESQ